MDIILIAKDPAMKQVVEEATRVAAFDTTTVLLEGETGTGKEVIARHIHLLSPRRDGPFTVLDCATIPETLLESELFGHEKGSYTGATATVDGILEQAEGGTLFLDEVSCLGKRAQAVLMRFIETHEIQRVGKGVPKKIDIRIIAATNQNLGELVRSGTFRRDLFHRLGVVRIWIPPLNQRKADIQPLMEYYLNYWAKFHRVKPLLLAECARKELINYNWPGNVRELRNAAEWFVIEASDGILDAELVHAHIIGPEWHRILTRATHYGGLLKDKQFVMQFVLAWSDTGGHVTNTAKKLGISAGSASRYSRALELS